MHRTVIIFMSLEVGWRGAVGFRIIRDSKYCRHFHGFGSGREGGGWPQNHKKRIGLLSFSNFWMCLGRGLLAPESQDMQRTVIIFMVLEVGGMGAARFRIIRNAWARHHFHVFGSKWKGGHWLQNHMKCTGLFAFSNFGNGWEGGGWPENQQKCKGLF